MLTGLSPTLVSDVEVGQCDMRAGLFLCIFVQPLKIRNGKESVVRNRKNSANGFNILKLVWT